MQSIRNTKRHTGEAGVYTIFRRDGLVTEHPELPILPKPHMGTCLWQKAGL